MLVSDSITKIRRLIDDVAKTVFTDSIIISLFGREQQNFCRKTNCLTDVYLIKAPPRFDYAFCFPWEEALVPDDRTFCPFFNGETYITSQPWEQEYDEDLVDGGATVTSGADTHHVEPQHEIPFFLPDDYYRMSLLLYNNRVVVYEKKQKIQNTYIDAWVRQGDVVDFFTQYDSLRKKAFITHSLPTTEQSSGTDRASQWGESYLDDVFYAFVVTVPDKPTADTDTVAIQDPFVKYVEFAVASKLLMADTENKSGIMSQHYAARTQIGERLVKRLLAKSTNDRVRRLGRPVSGRGLKPARPRLPSHYPGV